MATCSPVDSRIKKHLYRISKCSPWGWWPLLQGATSLHIEVTPRL